MTRLLRWATCVAALAALAVGVPWLLAVSIGNPVARLPDLLAGDINNQVVLAGLAAVVWLAWAQFVAAVLVELVSAVRRTPMPRRIPGVFGAQQMLARALVNGALLLLPVTVSTVAPAAQTIAMAAHPAAVWAATTPAGAARPAAAVPSMSTGAGVESHPVPITAHGPRTWWDLAERELGDGAAWRAVWALNIDRVQADGSALQSELLPLQPGWTVLVPGAAADAGSADRTLAGATSVTVEPGDTLSQLAVDHGVPQWQELWPENAGRVQPGGERLVDPDYLEPGWTITVPAADVTAVDPPPGGGIGRDSGPGRVVTVAAGDTLWDIAETHGVALPDLVAVNQGVPQPDGGALTDPDVISPGWRITVPDAASAGAGDAADTAVRNDAVAADPAAPADSAAPGVLTAPQLPAGVPPAGDRGAASSDADSVAGEATSTATQPAADTPAGTADIASSTASTPAPVPSTSPAAAAPATAPSSSSSAGSGAASTPMLAGPVAPRDAGAESGAPVLVLFTGAGGVLAALLLAALVRYRRQQFRFRRPGQVIRSAPDELVDMERAVLATGSARAGDAAWLDEALRGLAQQIADDPVGHLPEVVAARLTTSALELTLDAPRTDPPGEWTANQDGTRWALARAAATGYAADRRDFVPAPFPALATVGCTVGGAQWLLDLERISSLSVTGDPGRAVDLARFVAAELAHNTWAERLRVTLVGFGAEMARLHPARLRYAADPSAALAELAEELGDATRVIDESGADVLSGRLRGGSGETWAPHVLLVAPSSPSSTTEPGAAADDVAVRRLVDAVSARSGRSTVAVVIIEPGVSAEVEGAAPAVAEDGRWRISIDADGVLSVPALGLQLIAQQVPEWEAAQLAQLLAAAASSEQASPAPAARGTAGWEADADVTGNLRVAAGDGGELIDAASGRPSRQAQSVLPRPPQVYEERAATTAQDVAALAPTVTARVRTRVEASQETLDEDVREWSDPGSARPKVVLLGPVAVRVGDRVLSPWNTEIVAYLATRPSGVTAERYGTDLWPEDPDIAAKTRVRNSMYDLRQLIGKDYLPRGGAGPAVYRLEGALVDADLFRRLRVRGVARGKDGMDDLRQALRLVQGPPFSHRRRGGYGWLASPALDHEYAGMVVDVAHLVATHYLAEGEPGQAEAAAKAGLLVDSGDEAALIDLIGVCHARGERGQAEAYLRQLMAIHDVAEDVDLPKRTYEILLRRGWLSAA